MFFKDVPIYVIDFLNYMRTIKGLSPNTINEYYYDIRLFLKFILYRTNPFEYNLESLNDIDIVNLSSDLINNVKVTEIHSYLSYVDGERGNNSTTRSRKISSLKTFYKYMTTVARIIKNNPTTELESPKLKKRNPVYLTLNESFVLLETIQKESNSFIRKRDFAIILLFLTTGIRLSELSNLDVLNIKDLKFNVIGKGNKERTLFMTEACKYAIDEYLSIRPKTEETALFLSTRKTRISNRAIQHLVDKYILKSGFDPTIYSTHKLRHTAATLMYRQGVDIRTLQKILGHSSVSTTEIYTHLDDSQVKSAIETNPLSDIEIKNPL